MSRKFLINIFRNQMKYCFLIFIVNLILSNCRAEVRLSGFFGSHMVIQHGQEIIIDGMASPGENVSLTLGNEKRNTIANASGEWAVGFSARPPSFEPVKLIVEASNKIILDNLLFGDVWLCSGQSNMQWTLKDSIGGPELADSRDLQKIRLLHLRGRPQTQGREFSETELAKCNPKDYLTGSWEMISPESALDFSGVAIFFGQELMKHLNIPIGLVQNAVGGTPIESWLSRELILSDPKLKSLMEKDWNTNEMINSFCRDRAQLNLKNLNPQLKLRRPLESHPYHPGFMHESGIKPLQKMKFKGVIWYQGESNAHDPELYLQMFRKLIQSWRQFFHQPELPFLYVQLPNLENGINWPEFRDVQRRSLSMPATGMAVTIDVGDPRDVHPRLKLPVGHRIALIARAIAYGESIEYSGPLVQSAILKDKNIQVNFSHSENGLKTSDGNGPSSLELAGNDGVFRSVTGEIQGGAIVIATGNLNGPFELRYGWAPNPKCNLQNREGLPASPFQIRVEEK